MVDEISASRCYSLTVIVAYIVIGLLALVLCDSQTRSTLFATFFLLLSMGDDDGKHHSAESANAFGRRFTSCTSFVRSVTKGDNSRQEAGRKQTESKATIKHMPSKAKNKRQNTFSPSRSRTQTRSQSRLQQHKMATSLLFQAIDHGSFWTLPDEDLLVLIRDEFPNELNRLKSAYSVRTTGVPRPSTASISQILYQDDYDEINRTLVGVLALRWIWLDQYEAFIGSHSPSPVTLKPESFAWMQDIFRHGLKTTIDIYTLVLSMVTNDLGKDHNLASDYAKLKNIDISKVNHDMILLHAVEAGMVKSLDLLPAEQRAQLITGIKLGAEFNFGQLAQGENAPASLSGLLAMRGEQRAFDMRFMEQILDLSGAAGHEDWTCARKMIEPIFQSYRNVFDAARAIISGEMDLRTAYDIIPTRKLELLHKAGWNGHVDMKTPEGRALARLFCMGNTNSKDTADTYAEGFAQGINQYTRNQIVYGFNVEGSVDEPATQPSYAPAMLTKATGNTPNGTKAEKVKAIAAVLTYLARCFQITNEERSKFKAEKVTVIERDVRVIDKIVESKDFRWNCARALEHCEVPEGVAANFDHSELSSPNKL